MTGRVLLVGAGPGDPDLLTLRAVRALREADVVLIDDLVDRRVLEHVRPDARVLDVGKRGGCRSTPQDWIERLLVREARAGATVVRLKGGDPFVFGRGGEEFDAVTRAGLPCEIVSGITAGVAAAGAAQVPLTHRDHAQGVILVTGHAAEGNAIDWAALVATRLTLVIYMGVARAAEIESGLLAAGLAPDTPFAIVERAGGRGERVLHGTVASLASVVADERVASPAVFVIGAVAERALEVKALPSPAPPPLPATLLRAVRAARSHPPAARARP